jgi:hypothetical protein
MIIECKSLTKLGFCFSGKVYGVAIGENKFEIQDKLATKFIEILQSYNSITDITKDKPKQQDLANSNQENIEITKDKPKKKPEDVRR